MVDQALVTVKHLQSERTRAKADHAEFGEKGYHDASDGSEEAPVFYFEIQEFMTWRWQSKFLSGIQIPEHLRGTPECSHLPTSQQRIAPTATAIYFGQVRDV